MNPDRTLVNRRWCSAVVILVTAIGLIAPRAQDTVDARHRAYDEVLDLNVRDGLVYYRTLKSQRARLDGYVASLASASMASSPKAEQVAFWLNAYNAIVLQTVIDHYPIPQRNREYPAQSIRQIAGAFDRTAHRVAGQTLTLDQIEQTVLPPFQDPRVFLALGRGAMGSGRLRSEAYSSGKLERQLSEVARECATRAQCAEVDQHGNILKVAAMFSWREREFAEVYAGKAAAVFASRSPIERAAVAFISPSLLLMEREFLEKNAFRMQFIPFDWALNDLTGRGGR